MKRSNNPPSSVADTDPHQNESYNSEPHSDPHQSDKMDQDTDPHQFADDKPKCMDYFSIFEHFFKILSLYLEGRVRIRIKVKGRI